MKIKQILVNQVFIYLVSRYVTYGLQFLASVIIASKLGPYYMGIWGFLLLLINYFSQFHFGIANSLNVLLVQNKDDEVKCMSYINNSLLMIFFLSVAVALFYLYYAIIGMEIVDRYYAGTYIWAVCLIGIFQYFNGLFVNIFRVYNKLNSISLTQSLVVIVPFIGMFFFTGQDLVTALVFCYLFSNMACVVYALCTGIIKSPFRHIHRLVRKEILRKGILLFLYNACFAFIVISIRTIISSNYGVDEFGLFTFAFSLGNAVMMLMEALSFILFPKVISLLHSPDNAIVSCHISNIRHLYMSAAHLLMFIFFPMMPVLLMLMPEYQECVPSFTIIGLALLMNANNFAHSSLLIARNRERTVALISMVGLIVNIIAAKVLVYCGVTYNYVTLATLITYLLINALTYHYANREIGLRDTSAVWKSFFPVRLLIPYLVALTVSLLKINSLLWLPLVFFLALNIQAFRSMWSFAVKVAGNGNLINV